MEGVTPSAVTPSAVTPSAVTPSATLTRREFVLVLVLSCLAGWRALRALRSRVWAGLLGWVAQPTENVPDLDDLGALMRRVYAEPMIADVVRGSALMEVFTAGGRSIAVRHAVRHA